MENTNSFIKILNNIGDAVIVTDQQGLITYLNTVAQNLTGWQMEAVCGKPVTDIVNIHFQDTDNLIETMVTAVQNGSALESASTMDIDDYTHLIAKSGQKIPIDYTITPLKDDADLPTGIVITLRDITKYKAMETELEQTITELQHQTSLVETVLNSISDGIVVINATGSLLLTNPSVERIFGMQSEEIPPTQWAETYGIFYSDQETHIPLDQMPIMQVLEGKVIEEMEFFVRNKHRPEGVYAKGRAVPLFGSNQEIIGSIAIIRDITQDKITSAQLEQTITELQNQTSLMETVLNSISDGVLATGTDGNYLVSNQRLKELIGMSLIQDIEIDKRPGAYGLYYPDQETLLKGQELPLTRAMNGQPTDNFELFVRNAGLPDGLFVNVTGRPLKDSEDTLLGGVILVRDVTEIRQAETELQNTVKQLEEQGDLLESIFNSISDGVVVADENGNFTIFNPSAQKIVGIGPVDTGPDQWSDNYGLFFPDRVTPYPAEELPMTRAIQGETTDEVEMFVRNPQVPDGVFISVNGRPLQDDEGNAKGGVIVFRDVTHRIIAEEALTQAFAQGRLEIVETILHNIGNAINSVTVGMNVLQDNLVGNQLIHRFSALADLVQAHQNDWGDYITNDPKGQQVLPFMIALAKDFADQNKKVIETLDRVTERVTHIIDIIRTQRSFSQSNMTRKNINLEHSIQNAVKLQQDAIDKRGIDVVIDCQNTPHEIKIQESQFHQMLVNLLKNAIEAIDDLAQSGGIDGTPRIEVKVYTDAGFLVFDVTDNGIGIAQKDLKLIFNAGYTTKQMGTGLGLHSTANFVIGSGGKIYPFSEGVGKGATMRVMLRHTTIK